MNDVVEPLTEPNRTVAQHVVTGHRDVVGRRRPADVDGERRRRDGGHARGGRRRRPVGCRPEARRPERGVVEDHVVGAGGLRVADLELTNGRVAEIDGADDREVGDHGLSSQTSTVLAGPLIPRCSSSTCQPAPTVVALEVFVFSASLWKPSAPPAVTYT